MRQKINVGCYYFPNYHGCDERNAKIHGPGWSEWELVKAAKPRFPGHRQPKIPVWGYCDESDPKVMKLKIRAAQEHGIDYFIFDYYYYNDGPFLSHCLDNGFLPAVSGEPLRFALMWANHNWVDIHPCSRVSHPLLYPGAVSPERFTAITNHIIEHYFKHPNYYRMNGKPYFSIYHLNELIKGLGGFHAARKALADFRRRTIAAGFSGLELNAVVWGSPVLPGEENTAPREKVVTDLGFDSVSCYVWIHHIALPKTAELSYIAAMNAYFLAWQTLENNTPLPCYPNVTVGWDPSPRTLQSDIWEPVGYPYTCTLSDNTPENFRTALLKTRERLERSGIQTFSINCWNEWTEGSMLEPEEQYGMGYLEALRSVFPPHPHETDRRNHHEETTTVFAY